MLNTFYALRIYGPCDVDDLAILTGLSVGEIVADLSRLFQRRRATVVRVPAERPHPARALWDVTEAGRAAFDEDCRERALRRYLDGLCLGEERSVPR